ncbi:MAG: hypothetical protein JO108_14235 [Acidobacteriaceae bacterium]|nr:hypothetical protein [Acidobacteriaceae bacterium]
MEHLAKQLFAEFAFFVHGTDLGLQTLSGKTADRVLKHALFFAEDGEGRCGSAFGYVGHDATIIAPPNAEKLTHLSWK